MKQALVVFFFAAILAAALKADVQTTIASATVDSSGLLHLVYSDGSEKIPPKVEGQVAFGTPKIAADRLTVGWLAEEPNCCTSYPLPLSLVIYRGVKIVRVFTPGRAVFKWSFLSNGELVGYCTDSPHGESDLEWMLSKLSDGKLLEKWSLNGSQVAPEWVRQLESDNP